METVTIFPICDGRLEVIKNSVRNPHSRMLEYNITLIL